MGFSRRKSYIKIPSRNDQSKRPVDKNNAPTIPDGMWQKCPNCKQTVLSDDLGDNKVCPHCNYHFRLASKDRLAMVCDHDSFEELFVDDTINNPLDFPGYADKKKAAQDKTGLDEAIVTGVGRILNYPACIGVMDAHFMMGSMSAMVGEKITRLFEYALDHRMPVIIFTASGGARMQEGIMSLMQMAKVSQAVAQHSQAGLLYIPVLTDPTTGGVTASFAMQGDIILAEPGAMIGFAGKRVIEQTIRQELPENFQTAEHQLKHGFIDMIVPRWKMQVVLAELLYLHHQEVGR
ncbi:acetyl-CoA carboxylase carboxyl transferase subunit beta [Aerococcus urinaehominis]|uniref:Acetyl-coenzyme A carboxylase carboxyl transferase subunit beta n=1 Tax=Aerococcus urinaehominis TaxID=128944 RepID=A0A120IAL7_9LACT|nr:acetyl-CoA carboxylase, carboxyltransferase subunit beta [Aerococcus urinaehominis]AMB98498.1 acetyl-CoA carboxylase carboxyl transferase subunit beta [Aerococcus urinaehominis]SDL80642.1 acetyl-CoA carboxylase carboxyl transferase subunit beta [Aerococcus urinaehominis]